MDNLYPRIGLDVVTQLNEGSSWPPVPTRPVHVRGFLDREYAKELAEELLSRDDWVQSRYLVFAEDELVRSVSDAEYRTGADGKKVWRHGSLETIGAKSLRESSPLYQRLRRELLKSEVLDCFSEMMGVRVRPATDVNASMYGKGDFLASHQDTFEDWVSSFVIYLTDTSDCVGGELEFFNGAERHRVSVEAGDGVFIPIDDRFSHQVLAMEHGRRLSLNYHLRRA